MSRYNRMSSYSEYSYARQRFSLHINIHKDIDKYDTWEKTWMAKTLIDKTSIKEL